MSMIFSFATVPATAEEPDTSVNVLTEFKTSNLIENGGFEDGFEGWVTDDSGVFEVVEGTFTNPNGATHKVLNGTKAVKGTVTTTATKGSMYQVVDVTRNTNYVLNFSWFHFSNTKGSVKIYADSISSENLLATAGNIFGGEVWYSSTTTFNSGEHDKIVIKIEVFNPDITKYSALYCCIDNITLKAAGNTQIIDFEKGYLEDMNVRSSNYTISSAKANDGTYSMKLDSGTGYAIANAAFALIPGRHYAIIFYYYIESGSLGYATKNAHQNGWGDYTSGAHKTETLTTKGSWEKAIATQSVTGTGANAFVEIAFQNLAPNTVVYIDNIQCKYYDESVDYIKITGNNEAGGSLNAEVKAYNYGYNFEDPITYQWQRSEDDKTWTDISDATSENYTLTRADSQKYLRLKVNTTNRYGATISDSYYSKSIKITDIGYKHKYGTSYGVDVENGVFSVDDAGASVSFDCANKTDAEKDLSVFVGAYSDKDKLLNYEILECSSVLAGESAKVNKTFSDQDIASIKLVVFDADMNVYYTEMSQKLGADVTENSISFDDEKQEITITGINNKKPEMILVKDNSDKVEYINIVDAQDKAGYKVIIPIGADAYGKHTVYTSFCKEGYEFIYYSKADYERIVANFESDMDKAKVLEAYQALEVKNDLLDKIDVDKLVATINANRTEVTGDTLEAKMESAKALLNKMLVLEAYNQSASGLTDAEGKLIYADVLGLKDMDKNNTTFYKLYNSFVTKDGLIKLNAMLLRQNFANSDAFLAHFKKSLILCAIGYPAVNGVGHVDEILTEENMTDVGIDYSKYSTKSGDEKDIIHEDIVGVVFKDLSELETAINKDVTVESEGGGSTSSNKGSSSSIGITAGTNKKPQNENVEIDKVMTFTDVGDSHWAYKYIYALKEIGIINGVDDQHFNPNGLVTREQFVKMLCDAFNLKANNDAGDISFADCQSGAWYEGYIKIATSQGIVGGIGDGKFGIGRPVTREDLCVMAMRALDGSASYDEVAFVDSNEISEYAKSAVSALATLKVVSGFEDGTVRPKDSCTRAQAAKIIYELRTIKEIQQ